MPSRKSSVGEPEAAAAPSCVEPMKAQLADALPEGEEWLYELKLDGIRAIAVRDQDDVRLYSRRPREITTDFPGVVAALSRLKERRFVLDGELIALDVHGRSSFQALQNLKRDGRQSEASYVLFDLLHLGGRDCTPLPLVERRKLLGRLLSKASAPLRFSPSLEAPAAEVWKQVLALGLEGVIAKRRDSPYEPGRRSGAWAKIKAHQEQEFVIGGFTPPEGSRKYFGAILVGYYDNGRLLFASRVGTGFSAARLKELHALFRLCVVQTCPFENLPGRTQRQAGGITAAEMRRCTWLRPELVCQVKFIEWTRDGNLRHPVFLGLREDKPARSVVRERVDAGHGEG